MLFALRAMLTSRTRQNDATGKVLDNRPKSGRPCYHDLAALPSGEIKALWISVLRVSACAPPTRDCDQLLWQAVEKQMADLVAHEGEDALLVGTLKKELKEVRTGGWLFPGGCT